MSEQDTTTPAEARIRELGDEIALRSAEVQRTVDFVRDENRDLGASEQRELRKHRDRIVDLRAALVSAYDAKADEEARAEGVRDQTAERLGQIGQVMHTRGGSFGNPLAFSAEGLDRLQEALDTRTAVRVAHDVETRATLQVSTYGTRREWASNVLGGPRLLHVVAGVPATRVEGAAAAHPVLTLPTASASVAETVSLGEYAASTAGAVTLARFGRWTDFSRESQLGSGADAVVAMHQTGVALDLDQVLINATETAAGAAVAFSADVVGNVRKAMATVMAATAAANASDLVVLVHPDNVALLENVTPISGSTIGEGFQRFSGALVYPSLAVNTGFVTVANLRAGARYFEARGFTTETEIAVKTSVVTVASSVIAGFGITLVGAAVMQDVVTP